METHFINAISDFFQPSKDNIFSINKVENWLLKYSEDYKQLIDFNKSNYVSLKLENGKIVRLPPINENSKNKKFIDLYNSLERISEFHRNEEYFEKEIIVFNKISKSRASVKNWLLKNKNLVIKAYGCFLSDYLDYKGNNEEVHLNIFIHSLKDCYIYINRSDFKSTIEFLETFNDLYFIQERLKQDCNL